MGKVITITRKIELQINLPKGDEKNAFYKTLRSWRDIACQAANMMISIMYMNLKGESISFLMKKLKMIENRPFDFEELEKKIQAQQNKAENKEVYKAIEEEKKEFFEISEAGYYYRLLSAYYNESGIRTAILSCISNQVYADFTNDKSAYLRQNQSLRTYKQTMPMPFTAQSIRQVRRHVDEKDKTLKDFAFSLFGIPFRTYFGRDRSNNYFLMNEALSMHFIPKFIEDEEENINKIILESRAAGIDQEPQVHYLGTITLAIEYAKHGHDNHRYKITATQGDKTHVFFMFPRKPKKNAQGVSEIPGYKIGSNYKLCDSQIQLTSEQHTNDNGKRYDRTKIFLLASLQFEEEPYSLDPDKCANCELDPEIPIKVTIGKKTFNIGSKNDFEYRRIGIQGAYRATQRDLKGTKGGRGRKQKLQALDRYKQYEKDVVKLKIFQYTRQLLKICLENNCKYIYLHIPKKPTENNKTEEETKYLIRNWSYGRFQNVIEFQGSRLGIEVATVEEKEQTEQEG